jgi:hypothetical protein
MDQYAVSIEPVMCVAPDVIAFFDDHDFESAARELLGNDGTRETCAHDQYICLHNDLSVMYRMPARARMPLVHLVSVQATRLPDRAIRPVPSSLTGTALCRSKCASGHRTIATSVSGVAYCRHCAKAAMRPVGRSSRTRVCTSAGLYC